MPLVLAYGECFCAHLDSLWLLCPSSLVALLWVVSSRWLKAIWASLMVSARLAMWERMLVGISPWHLAGAP